MLNPNEFASAGNSAKNLGGANRRKKLSTATQRVVLSEDKGSVVRLESLSTADAITQLYTGKAQALCRLDADEYALLDLEGWVQYSKLHSEKLDPSQVIRTVNQTFVRPNFMLSTTNATWTVVDNPLRKPSRAELLKRDQYTCRYCSYTHPRGENLNIDHVIPQSRAEEFFSENARAQVNAASNLVISCVPCNTFKADRTPEEANLFLKPEPAATQAPVVSLQDALQRSSFHFVADEMRTFMREAGSTCLTLGDLAPTAA